MPHANTRRFRSRPRAILAGGLIALGLVGPVLAQSPGRPTPSASPREARPTAAAAGEGAAVYSVSVDGPITSVTADYVARGLGRAEAEEAAGFLIVLDTPGGSVDSMLEIAGSLLNASLPTLVWVGPRGAQAASAGTFLVLAADAAGMAPNTTIGAASPVGAGGEDLPETMDRKVTEDLAATARSYADRRGEPAARWAEDAVRRAASATAEEALALGVIDAIAASPQALLEEIDGLRVEAPPGEQRRLATRDAAIEPVEPDLAERLLGFLAHPAVALLLLTIGVNAILIELSNPGGFVAGIIGVLALVLAFYSLGALDANLIGLVFVLAAVVLFVLELKSPSMGLLTMAGLGLFVAGAVILFRDSAYGVPWFTIGLLGLATTAFFAIVVRASWRTMRQPPQAGVESLIGQPAEVMRALAPEGLVLIQGERWRAVLLGGGSAPVGARVRVTGRSGHTLQVRAEPEAAGVPGEPPEPPAGSRPPEAPPAPARPDAPLPPD